MISNLSNCEKEIVVIKLSGSLFDLDTTASTLKKYAELLIDLDHKIQPIVVTGGGKIARHYIDLARSLGSDESTLDIVGINVSRLNAMLLVIALGNRTYPQIPETLEEVAIASQFNKIVITGGFHPGQSTNATSALISEKVRAGRFINATDVSGIYDSDPNENPNARLFSDISVAQCIQLLSKEKSQAGTYELMDIVALKVIERSRIPTIVTVADVNTLKDIVLNKSSIGTRIRA
ncbi:MAG: UMP kinase [Thermoproteota archaeon]|nr:UMP kinase [Thermoproteota archaeon]